LTKRNDGAGAGRFTGAGGLQHAGLGIGLLERIFVLTLVLYDEFTAIMLVLTAKSIARFEDLKRREFAEYYLMGPSRVCSLVALFIGLLSSWLSSQL
jgi:hypothetical protein